MQDCKRYLPVIYGTFVCNPRRIFSCRNDVHPDPKMATTGNDARLIGNIKHINDDHDFQRQETMGADLYSKVPDSFCRVRVTSPASECNLNYFRVNSTES